MESDTPQEGCFQEVLVFMLLLGLTKWPNLTIRHLTGGDPGSEVVFGTRQSVPRLLSEERVFRMRDGRHVTKKKIHER